jgi:outer membrane protein OmpA-like peptidoglycan-associated protein
MKKIISSLALVSSVAFVPVLAQAQTPEGPYVAVHGGVNFNDSSDLKFGDTTPFPGQKARIKTDTGYAAGGAFGYSFGNFGFGSPRLELEGTWRSNNIKHLDVGGSRVGGHGNVDSVAIMTNALMDFDTGTNFYPYLGGGFGAVMGWVDSDYSDTVFGYQGIAGVGYNVTENVGLTLDYRYLGSSDWKDGGATYGNYSNHTVLLGLRYAFGTPTPSQPPVAQREVAAVPDSYLVFFDHDRYAITPEASGVISTAAGNAKSKGTSVIEVTGHTDTSGSPAYNMGLSKRRADAVAAELQRNGIPRSEIAIFARGQNDLLVPTADGVREPQNRRVVIVLR